MEWLGSTSATTGAITVKSTSAGASKRTSSSVLTVGAKLGHIMLLNRRVSGNRKGAVTSDHGRDNLVRSRSRRDMEHGRCGAKRSKSRSAVLPDTVHLELPASSRVATNSLSKLKSVGRVLVGSIMGTACELANTIGKYGLEKSSLYTHSPQVPVECGSEREKKEKALGVSRGSTCRDVMDTDPSITTKSGATLPLVAGTTGVVQ